jgi:hypothetical protein
VGRGGDGNAFFLLVMLFYFLYSGTGIDSIGFILFFMLVQRHNAAKMHLTLQK